MSYMLKMLAREEKRLLTGRCTVTRGDWPEYETVDTDVGCVVRPSQQHTTEVTSGGQQVSLHVYEVRVPWDLDVERGDMLTVDKSRDPKMVGRALTVVEVVADEWAATRMVVCQESRQ